MLVNDTGKLVATVRGYRGLSQAKLSEMSGVPHAYISRFENNLQSLSDEHLERLAVALGVNFAAIYPAFTQFAAAMNGSPAPVAANAPRPAADGA